jgi:hypothetical protein
MTGKNEKQERSAPAHSLYVSLLLVLLALVSISAATVAWFTIADRTRLRSMNMEITSGANLRFDLDAHEAFEDYVKTLTFEQIAARILRDTGVDMTAVPLDPVTTTDYTTFTLEDGVAVEAESGSYLEFTLHFMASQDMLVHLTSANSENGADGTLVSSENSDLPSSMRISFATDDNVWIYDPGMGAESQSEGNAKTFGLADADRMVLSNDNALFSLKEGVDQPIKIHVWLEGTDERCTDALQGADYSIRLRFLGTDEENNVLDGTK